MFEMWRLRWWARGDSNARPLPCQGSALNDGQTLITADRRPGSSAKSSRSLQHPSAVTGFEVIPRGRDLLFPMDLPFALEKRLRQQAHGQKTARAIRGPNRQLTKRAPSPETVRHAPEKAGRGLWAKPTDTPGEFRENRVPAAFGYFPRVQRGGALTGSAESSSLRGLAPQMCRDRGHSPETPDGTRWHRKRASKIAISWCSKQLRSSLSGNVVNRGTMRRTNSECDRLFHPVSFLGSRLLQRAGPDIPFCFSLLPLRLRL